MTDVVDTVLEEIGQLPLWAVLVTVCVVMALETTMMVGVVVPGDIVVLFAASSGRSVPALVLLVLAVTLGSLTGETIGYGLGRRWGTRLRASRAGQRLGEERWDRAAGYLHDRGGRAVFLARYLAAVHAITPIVAGTVGMRYRRFITWCAVGGLSWSALYVVLGALAGASYRRYAESLGTATSVVIGGLIGAGVFLAVVWLRDRAADRDRAQDAPDRAADRDRAQDTPDRTADRDRRDARVGPVLARLRVRLSRPHGPLGDVALVAALGGAVAVAVAAAEEAGSREPGPLAYAIAVAGVVALLGRRRWPLPVLAVTVVAFGAYHLLDYPAGPPLLAVAAAVYGTARAGQLPPALAAGGLVTGSGIAYRWLVEGDNVLGVETALGAALLVTVALLGDATRSRLTGTPQPWVPSITCVDVRQSSPTDNQRPASPRHADERQWAEASRC